MRIGDIYDTVWCIHEAVEHDLPDVIIPARQLAGRQISERHERPHHAGHPIDVHAWQQSWSNTSLGMGGMAGQAISSATTTVIVDRHRNIAAVYVAKHLRGLVSVTPEWFQLLANRDVIRNRYPHGAPWTPPEPDTEQP